MQLRTLEPCSGLWGRDNVLDGLPRIRIVEDAIYVPWSHGGPWGVFDADGHPVREAMNLRTVNGLPSGPQPVFPPAPPSVDEERDATHLYLGLLHPHYGHFIVNTFARLWPFVFGRERLPHLVWHTIGDGAGYANHEFLTTILASLGSSLKGIEAPEGVVRFKRLLVPETSFHEQFCVYPVFRSIGSIVGTPLYALEEVDTIETPVFLSKARLTGGVGRFDGESVIEDELRRAGVDIVHPEKMRFVEQVRLFARRRCILATSGSALHTSVFGPPRRRIISVNPMREVNTNFSMIDRLNRNEIAYFFPKNMTYSSTTDFITTHHAPDPEGIAADLLALAGRA